VRTEQSRHWFPENRPIEPTVNGQDRPIIPIVDGDSRPIDPIVDGDSRPIDPIVDGDSRPIDPIVDGQDRPIDPIVDGKTATKLLNMAQELQNSAPSLTIQTAAIAFRFGRLILAQSVKFLLIGTTNGSGVPALGPGFLMMADPRRDLSRTPLSCKSLLELEKRSSDVAPFS
jgi:hypothetical protein